MPESLTPQFKPSSLGHARTHFLVSKIIKNAISQLRSWSCGFYCTHFNCLPSSLLHCTSASHAPPSADDQEEAHQWTHHEASGSRRQESHIWLRRHWFLLGFFAFRRNHWARKVYLPCALQPQETHTPWCMWDEKPKNTHSGAHTADGARRRFLQIFLCFFHIRLVDPMRQAHCFPTTNTIQRTHRHSRVDLVLMHLYTNDVKTTIGTSVSRNET